MISLRETNHELVLQATTYIKCQNCDETRKIVEDAFRRASYGDIMSVARLIGLGSNTMILGFIKEIKLLNLEQQQDRLVLNVEIFFTKTKFIRDALMSFYNTMMCVQDKTAKGVDESTASKICACENIQICKECMESGKDAVECYDSMIKQIYGT